MCTGIGSQGPAQDEDGDDARSEAPEEPLSDLDDDEIDAFIHTEEESKIKELVWNTMHSDYIKEQAEKQARRAQQEQVWETTYTAHVCNGYVRHLLLISSISHPLYSAHACYASTTAAADFCP